MLNSKESSQDSTDSADTTTVLLNPRVHAMQNGESLQNQILTSKPVITGAILKDDLLGGGNPMQQEDTFQEQQRKLGNGTLTPEHRRQNEHGVSVDLKS